MEIIDSKGNLFLFANEFAYHSHQYIIQRPSYIKMDIFSETSRSNRTIAATLNRLMLSDQAGG